MLETICEEIRKGLCKVKSHSKEVEKGDVFVALPGSKRKGSDFIPEAIERGAKYIISSDKRALNYKDQVKIFICEDVFSILGKLARYQYNTFDLPYLIGITGTNGKTTVSYLLEHIFRKAGLSVGVIGTISYRWDNKEREADLTTPGCLEIHKMLSEMKEKVDVVIMEVSSHALDQRRVEGIEFDMAIFTNLTQDHLDYHKDMKSYFNAKKRLFSKYLKPKGIGITNLDDFYGNQLMKESLAYYGYTFFEETFLNNERIMLSEVILNTYNKLVLEVEFKNKRWISTSSLIGKHNAYNLASAQLAGYLFGLNQWIFSFLEDFKGVPGRLEKVYSNGLCDIYVDYAHTPDGLRSVLYALKELKYKRIILVFGCGGERDKDKRPKMGMIASKYADFLIITSDNPRKEDPELIIKDILAGVKDVEYLVEVDRKKAIKKAIEIMQKGDAILIAGKGHEKYQYIDGKKIRFSDREVVLELLKKDEFGSQ